VSSLGGPTIKEKRKDSKLVNVEDMINLEDMINCPHQPEELYFSSSSWDDDPYLNYLEATMHFLEVFFAQSAHEVSMMFPRRAFTPWVRQYHEKRRRDCTVLYGILAMGSIYTDNRSSAFARLCAEGASQAVSSTHLALEA
jgi:hypothetical protein